MSSTTTQSDRSGVRPSVSRVLHWACALSASSARGGCQTVSARSKRDIRASRSERMMKAVRFGSTIRVGTAPQHPCCWRPWTMSVSH